MIGLFTDPFTDELLYSVVSRYHHRVRNSSKEATARDLFGHAQTKIIVDFQTRLDYLASQLPPKTYPVSRLIDDHTMLPFYAPFMPAERHEELRRDMRGEGGGSIHARLGVLTSGLVVERLRLCPACAEDENKAADREPYWHRIHQAPGVMVCPEHAVFLVNSAVKTRKRMNNEAFVTVRQAIAELPSASRSPIRLDPANKEHQILLSLAQRAASIFKARTKTSDLNTLRGRYLRLLFKRGLAKFGDRVNHSRLKQQFLDYYSPELLNLFGCGLDLRNHWLRCLLNDWNRSRHPFHHLLLMEFLGRPIEEFFQRPIEVEPFGKGPWPCLNKASSHYGKEVITTCQIAPMQKKPGRLTGTFRCDCGFTYRRIGPDSADERRYQYDRILTFGEAWYKKLRGLLPNRKKDLPEIAVNLGVKVNIVMREINRLKESAKTGQILVRSERRRSALNELELRERHRMSWQKVVEENPNLGRQALRLIEGCSYSWLTRNDREWLETNSPARLVGHGTEPRVDWLERDETYSIAVRQAAERILNTPGRPIWASRTGIASELGILAVVHKRSGKLPLTNKALYDVSESKTSFAARRIRWAADCFREERIAPNKWKLQSRAAVSNKMAANQEIKAVCEECIRMLNEMREHGWLVSIMGLGNS
jgi:hypothetical protein